MKSGIELIAEERTRQISEEGWTPEHDDTHSGGAMAAAASCYAWPQWGPQEWEDPTGFSPVNWPWEHKWWKPSGSRIRDLVKSGALIAAEIDRLQRANKIC